MSTDARTQTGQVPPPGDAPAAADGRSTPQAAPRESPQSLIQESIRYRRRAQEAERRAEALEAEVSALRQAEHEHADALAADLAQARAEAETLRGRLAETEREGRLERELLRTGCADTETALALARQRLAGADPPEDLAAFARGLLEEKPHLRGSAPPGPAACGLPPRTASAKPPGASAPRQAAERLAEQAKASGSPADLMAYMRARRGTTA